MMSPNEVMSQLYATIAALRVYLSPKHFLGFLMAQQSFPISIEEVDEALNHATTAKLFLDFTPKEKEIINQFIDGLLDARLELIGK
jgi:hypothetical protein